jgi:hypothetical protein
LRLQPSDVGWIIRIPKLIDERAGAYKLAIVIDQNEGRIHYTVSASILSYGPEESDCQDSCLILLDMMPPLLPAKSLAGESSCDANG